LFQHPLEPESGPAGMRPRKQISAFGPKGRPALEHRRGPRQSLGLASGGRGPSWRPAKTHVTCQSLKPTAFRLHWVPGATPWTKEPTTCRKCAEL